eukprot:2324674-Pyramimonas_sp.AAC.1
MEGLKHLEYHGHVEETSLTGTPILREFEAMQQSETIAGDRGNFKEWSEQLQDALAQVSPS